MTITLREFCNDDVERFTQWLKKEYVAKWYSQPDEWIEEVTSREFSWIRHFIAECDGRAIGFCQYYEYCRGGETWHGDIDAQGVYSIDYMIGETDFVGKGMGTQIVDALCEKIRSVENARLIIAQPETENKASCATLLAAGFKFDTKNKLYKYVL